MDRPREDKEIRSLLPLYAQGALSPEDRQRVEAWARQDPEVDAELAAWEAVRRAAIAQPEVQPSSEVEGSLITTLRARSAGRTRRRPRPSPRKWWLGAVIAALLTLTLWRLVQPGVVLQWSVAGSQPEVYRVFRAPAGSDAFELLSEVPARPDQARYTFVDPRLAPGQRFVYRVEGLSPGGARTISQPVRGDGFQVLPIQLTILVTSLIASYSLVLLLEGWRRWDGRAVLAPPAEV
jgi:hypothetical protein